MPRWQFAILYIVRSYFTVHCSMQLVSTVVTSPLLWKVNYEDEYGSSKDNGIGPCCRPDGQLQLYTLSSSVVAYATTTHKTNQQDPDRNQSRVQKHQNKTTTSSISCCRTYVRHLTALIHNVSCRRLSVVDGQGSQRYFSMNERMWPGFISKSYFVPVIMLAGQRKAV